MKSVFLILIFLISIPAHSADGLVVKDLRNISSDMAQIEGIRNSKQGLAIVVHSGKKYEAGLEKVKKVARRLVDGKIPVNLFIAQLSEMAKGALQINIYAKGQTKMLIEPKGEVSEKKLFDEAKAAYKKNFK